MNEEHRRQLQFYMDRTDLAYKHAPFGTWMERWIPFVCEHKYVRCTHGDEIIGRRYRRRVCMSCGRSLKGPLPDPCFFTGEPHSKWIFPIGVLE